ncbi:MAG: hypothetical protein J0I98_14155 [Mesorhizobium sp.]|nr:hypothetical protein [Mesorhizobium sp.]MBN9243930.1 hypothetical protein [Mesorhizobium sp.]
MPDPAPKPSPQPQPVNLQAALNVAGRQNMFDAQEKLLLTTEVLGLQEIVKQRDAEIERLTAELAKFDPPPAEPLAEGAGGTV